MVRCILAFVALMMLATAGTAQGPKQQKLMA
jgi:hypothetical protein